MCQAPPGWFIKLHCWSLADGLFLVNNPFFVHSAFAFSLHGVQTKKSEIHDLRPFMQIHAERFSRFHGFDQKLDHIAK
jgi:hypothetical protein